MKPLAIDLFCGLGGWSTALLAEGYDVVGFDIERHRYPRVAQPTYLGGGAKSPIGSNPGGSLWRERIATVPRDMAIAAIRNASLTGGWIEYPAQLVIQDVLTLHGSQFRDAALIVASPPCQAYSWMAMPWKLAKARAAEIRADATGQKLADLNRLFDACFRIQAEASLAAGRHVPMIVENVRGAEPWVGRARANFGSFYLWGDVPGWAEQPDLLGGETVVHRRRMQTNTAKQHIGTWSGHGKPGYVPFGFNRSAEAALKVPGFRFDGSGRSFQSASVESRKHDGSGWRENCSAQRRAGSGSSARKAASALIARIPEPLARHIARTYRP